MAEANDAIKYWISMIKDHVDLNGIDGQEVHNFYNGLDDDKRELFKIYEKKRS
jgi:hypothetical protein